MSIRQYFTSKEDNKKPCFGLVSTLSSKETAIVNLSVEKALEVNCKRRKYNKYSRAKIGKYAAENGASRAARHYSKVMGVVINESTVRKMKSEYLEKLKTVKDVVPAAGVDVVPSLPTKHQGRPLLLSR